MNFTVISMNEITTKPVLPSLTCYINTFRVSRFLPSQYIVLCIQTTPYLASINHKSIIANISISYPVIGTIVCLLFLQNIYIYIYVCVYYFLLRQYESVICLDDCRHEALRLTNYAVPLR